MVNMVASNSAAVIDSGPLEMRVIPHLKVPLSDETIHFARVWLPGDAESNPVRTIIEFASFLLRDFTAPTTVSGTMFTIWAVSCCITIYPGGRSISLTWLGRLIPKFQPSAGAAGGFGGSRTLRWCCVSGWVINRGTTTGNMALSRRTTRLSSARFTLRPTSFTD